MVTHKRGTVAWLFTATVLLALSTLGFAQSKEYTSQYLANTHPARLKSNTDNARARSEAVKERFGVSKPDAKLFINEAKKQQQLYRSLLPGGNAPAGVPSWQSL